MMNIIEQIGDAIWKVQSGQPGPSLAILGGTHGNELTGIEVVKKLVEKFSQNPAELVSGTLYLALGNLEAIKINERGSGGERDLNRMFEQTRFDQDPDGTYEDARAREIASKVLDHADIFIDIHSDHKPSEPFLVCSNSPKHEAVYRWFTTDKIVTDPDYMMGGRPVTTDEYVDLHGGIGICYETGYAQDTSRINEVYEDTLNILRDQKMIQDGVALTSPAPKETLRLVDRIIIDERGFKFADNMGKNSFQAFKAGDILGYQGNDPFIAKQDGCFIFPKPEKLFWKGTPATWIAEKN